MSTMNKKVAFIIAILTIGLASRFIPHFPNFTAIGAMALLSGSMLRKPLESMMIPIVALIVSDLVLNNVLYAGAEFTLFYEGALFVYIPVVLAVLLGRLVNNLNARNYVLLSIASTILFFLLSNYGVWLTGLVYPETWSGLIACYVAGIPYALSTLAGTLVYGVIIMVAYNALTRQTSLQFNRL